MRTGPAIVLIIGLPTLGALLILSGDLSGSKIAPQRRNPPPVLSESAVKPVTGAPRHKLIEAYGKLPLSFEPCVETSCGSGPARFVSRGPGYTLLLTPTEAVLTLRKSEPRPSASGGLNPSHDRKRADQVCDSRPGIRDSGFPDRESRIPSPDSATVLRMKLVNANPAPKITGLDPLPGKSNYFIGNDPAKWRTNVPTYSKVKYEAVYPGIDLIFYGNPGTAGQLEYDFVVAPGADPTAIKLEIQGADEIEEDGNGDLLLGVCGEQVRLHKPLVYQEANGVRQEISGGYVLQSKNQVGFHVASYDSGRLLVIDPVLVYARSFGGSGTRWGNSIAVDESANVYIVGSTTGGLTTTPGSFQTELRGSGSFSDIFIAKLNSTGDSFVYSTYLGGTANDDGTAIAVDGFGNAYITGWTQSNDFPVTSGALQTFLRGTGNAFVAKLNALGSAVVYSTYVGGRGQDNGTSIALDTAGNVYIGGATFSKDYPRLPELSSGRSRHLRIPPS